jgi:hypothetical protein
MTMKKRIVQSLLFTLLFGCIEEPIKEDVPELITKVILTFTPTDGGIDVIATATDPDGEGIQNLMTDGTISLLPDKSYSLSISILNELADVTSPEYNITDEVEEEGTEHMIFYSWTEGMFTSPTGNGNIDNRADEVNYEDQDSAGLPIGLFSSWITTSNAVIGKFRMVLKHQPELKSVNSGFDVGETDLDVSFDIEIQ